MNYIIDTSRHHKRPPRHQLTLTTEQIERHCSPGSGKRYYRLTGTRLLVRLSDNLVVSQRSDFLTARELEIAHKALKTAVNDAKPESDGRLDRKWAETAVRRELEAIGRCHGDNPHRPDSEFWASLIKIASVLKGSGRQHIAPSRVRTAVLEYAPMSLRTKGNREKDINYLFGRAMNQARPRYRSRGVTQQ